jgi:hypothetical protein
MVALLHCSSDLPQTPNLIFLILSVTIPPVPIPFAQIMLGPFPTPSPSPLPLLPQHPSALLHHPSLAAPELLTCPSHPFPVDINRRRPHLHQHHRPSAPPIVLYMGAERLLSSRYPSSLHNPFHPPPLFSLPSLLLHGPDMAFPQTRKQAFLVPEVPIVPSHLFPVTDLLLDLPLQHPLTPGICPRVVKAVQLPPNLTSAHLVAATPILKVFNPHLKL